VRGGFAPTHAKRNRAAVIAAGGSGGQQYKYNPGDSLGASYQFSGEDLASVKAAWDYMIPYPQFNAGYLVSQWKKHQTGPSTYDWSFLDACIAYLNNTTVPGKFITPLHILWEPWNVKFTQDTATAAGDYGATACPAFILDGGGVDVRPYSWDPAHCSTVANFELAWVRDAYIAFLQAAGTRYNGNQFFEGLEIFGETDQNSVENHLIIMDAIRPYWNATNLFVAHNWVYTDATGYNPGPDNSAFTASCVSRLIGQGGPDMAYFTETGINPPSYESDGNLAWRGAGSVGGKNYDTTNYRGRVPYKLGREFANNTLSLHSNDNSQIAAYTSMMKTTHRHWWPYYDAAAASWPAQLANIVANINAYPVWSTYPTDYPASSIGITDLVSNFVYQRTGTTADIAVAGTYAGTIDEVQCRVVSFSGGTEIVGWTTVDSSLSGNVWSGTMPGVPQSLTKYRLEARSRLAGVVQLTAAGTTGWYVGAQFGGIGSSTMELWAADYGTGESVTGTCLEFNAGLWQNYGLGNWHAPFGCGTVAFLNAVSAELGCAVAMIPFGVSGSTLAQWGSGMGYSGYANFMNNGVIPCGSKLEGVVCVVGLNDAPAIVSRATHLTALRLLRDTLRTALGQPTLPWFQLASQRYVSGTDAKFLMLHQAENDFGADSNTYLASCIGIPQEADQLHATVQGMRDQGKRVALLVADVLGNDTFSRGPFISGISNVDSTHTDVTITHRGGSDFTPTSGITGFQLTDNAWGSTITVSAAVRQNSTGIRLTHPAAGATRDVRYMAPAYPDDSGYVKDNTTLPLPLEFYAT
jgi:hypothetical protein